ncbi:MAG: coiled-coil domain-containing protein, partial [Planctomycetota bacterium]
LSINEQNIKRLKEEEPLITSEIDLLEEQIAQSVQKEYESKQKLQELEAVNDQRSKQIKSIEDKFSQEKDLRQSKTSELTELKISLGQLTEQNKALERVITSLQNQAEQNYTSQKEAQAEIKNCTEQIGRSQREILRCETGISELFSKKEESQKNSKELHDKVEKLLGQRRQVEQLVKQKRTQEDEIEQNLNQLKIELSQLEVKQQGLIEGIRDRLQIELEDAYKNYKDGDNNVDWDAIREEITELQGKIERLGNVNLDAIDEQEDLEKRNEFLTSQVDDLNKSKAQLQQLINRLNKISRERFRETFEVVRQNFQELFRKLFGGGKADIILEEADDILDAGIEIIARPPGKELRSISLLSGGEKSMTAIALLFSVFKAKPSPFCFLDEVDAALDEANNERFNLIIREFQKDSQFIIITHAKRTMSIADSLFGITMQIRGVSKKIGVKFGEYEVENETAAVA